MRNRFAPEDICGEVAEPPPLTLEAQLVDWTNRETTTDQARIESALDELRLGPSVRLLHVGVGNSSLATRFAGKVELIDGLTVVEQEWHRANSLGLANYGVHLLNKYSANLQPYLGRQYDFIVDNNLASFACCTYHFYRMLDSYQSLLRPNGRVLTDQEGLNWRADGQPGWELSFELLEDLAARFGLLASRINHSVYELLRPARVT
jgi:hypothetical protein